MTLSSSLPWLRINDFLVEVGSMGNDEDFIHCVMQHIEKLVPCDLYCVFGVFGPDGKICARKTVVESEKWFNCFNKYYWRTFPDVSKEKGINTKTVDWNCYLDTEFAADFMIPQHIRYSLGVQNIGKSPGFVGSLALNRSKTSPQFNEREQRIMEVLQPHLSNFYRVFTQPVRMDSQVPDVMELAATYKCFTRREVEITALLCRRYSTEMIQSKLFISRLTIYKHIENIFDKLGVASRDELATKILGEKNFD